jgi:CRISPR system Cascade subunit CasE
MTELYLSRARLRRDAPVQALAHLLVPRDGAARISASHHLVWSLFTDGPERRRDFLWREEKPGHFYTLSARPPDDPHRLFDVEFKPFTPLLDPGDRLGFSLRANPVISRQEAHGTRGKRHDVVMDALRHVPKGEQRPEQRPAIVTAAGAAWLVRQGTAHGFVPDFTPNVDGYETVRLPREPTDGDKKPKPIMFGILDIAGVLTVRDPPRFLAALATGFGRSRAFGCGLMLIRRAPP